MNICGTCYYYCDVCGYICDLHKEPVKIDTIACEDYEYWEEGDAE